VTTILVVDDSDVERAIYVRILLTLHLPGTMIPIAFADPTKALTWSESNDFDLAIVDYSMPGINGLDFISALRGNPAHRDTPIVMVTSATEHDVRYRALALGANDFVTKPIDRIEFIARVQNMLALSRSYRKLADRAAWLSDEVARATAGIIRRERETVFRLTRAAEFRDNETGAHILRMGLFCAEIAAELGMHKDECDMILMAAPMHDVGKVATPDAILLKRGRLSPEEWVVMRQHTLQGYEILKESESSLLQLAAEIALSHHEKFDGSGYPGGLVGNAIPLSGRICAVSDVFDALTSQRPYKEAWSIDRAVNEIFAGSTKHFDPAVVSAFRSALPRIVDLKERNADLPVAM
jgi:response regulator RpfG family c-di-GMP phosphodiesterase